MTTGFQITRRAALAVIVAFPAAASQTEWARRLDMPGVPNLHQVTPQTYRSAQPNALGFQNLANLGIKTVINLRRTVDDSPLAAGTGLDLIHIKITTRHVSDDNSAKIVRAMQALRDAQAKAPVLLHCTHGADRTGLIMALWRILFQSWSREAALDELINGGFGFHHVWINIPQYLHKVDLIDLKARIDAGA